MTETSAITKPSAIQLERWLSGLRRNQPRSTTSSYIIDWTRLRVGAKVFFSSSRCTTSRPANTGVEQVLLVSRQRGAVSHLR